MNKYSLRSSRRGERGWGSPSYDEPPAGGQAAEGAPRLAYYLPGKPSGISDGWRGDRG